MSTRPMVPVGGAGAMRKRKPLAPTTTGANRPTMGTSAFHLVDDASATDVRAGYLAARPEGRGTDQSIFGTGPARKSVEVGGPQFGISASRGAQAETYAGTLANGRLMRPATRTPGREFTGSAVMYGPTGPGQSSGGGGRRSAAKPKGAWTPPKKSKTS